jgi:hypothetical protein
MDIKKIITVFLAIFLVLVIFSKTGKKKITPQEVTRLQNSLTLMTCGDDLQKLIPTETASTNNIADGIKAIGEGDPAAAAELASLIKMANPRALPAEAKIDSADLAKALAIGFKRNGWSTPYASTVVKSQNTEAQKRFTAELLDKMKSLCPQITTPSDRLVNEIMKFLNSSAAE